MKGSEDCTCAYCGQPLVLVNRPNIDGTDGWEIDHVDMMKACDLKCPMVMCSYRNYEDAIAAMKMRPKSNRIEMPEIKGKFYVRDNGKIGTRR